MFTTQCNMTLIRRVIFDQLVSHIITDLKIFLADRGSHPANHLLRSTRNCGDSRLEHSNCESAPTYVQQRNKSTLA